MGITKAHLNFAQYRTLFIFLFSMKMDGNEHWWNNIFFHIACRWKQIKSGLEKSEKYPMWNCLLIVFHDWLMTEETDHLNSSEV